MSFSNDIDDIDDINERLRNIIFVKELDEFGNELPQHHYVVVSIDVGLHHLGFSLSLVSKNFKLIRIEWVDLIDLTKYEHNFDLYGHTCNIDHNSKQICDYIEHFFQDYSTLLDLADFILVEKQPPQGLVVIEQLILYKFRNKTHLISPRSMHSFFGISSGHLNISSEDQYEYRKKQTQIIAECNCNWYIRAKNNYVNINRKHDITDSICLMLFWLSIKNKEYTKEQNILRIKNTPMPTLGGISALDWLESYRYIQY